MSHPYLHMSLWLHEAAHDSKAGKELSRLSTSGHARNNCVVRALIRTHHIRMGRVKHKVGPTILHKHTSTSNDGILNDNEYAIQ